MEERKTPTFSFSRRLGNTNYNVNVFCDPNAKATYEDRVLELIRILSPSDLHRAGENRKEQQTT